MGPEGFGGGPEGFWGYGDGPSCYACVSEHRQRNDETFREWTETWSWGLKSSLEVKSQESALFKDKLFKINPTLLVATCFN